MKLDRTNKKFIPLYSIPLKEDIYLKIKPTANAWWKDQSKVQRLMALLYVGLTVEKACKNIGISRRKYKYFVQIHPEVTEIHKIYKSGFLTTAERTVKDRVEKDPKFALKYLRKKKPEEFPPPLLLNKIVSLEEYAEEQKLGFLREVRELKIIIGMYKEVFDELRPGIRGWYKERLNEADQVVRNYNKLHKRNNEKILNHKSGLGL
ncbi:MAG: hypothetical protein M3Q34_02315 [bacterium]|nr:hypothetical protein [bacterium]